MGTVFFSKREKTVPDRTRSFDVYSPLSKSEAVLLRRFASASVMAASWSGKSPLLMALRMGSTSNVVLSSVSFLRI